MPQRHLILLLTNTLIVWTGQRLTAIALPLVALEQTGSPWVTGLVGGAAGLPVLTAPWWAARLRDRIDSGRAIAGVLLVQTVGYLVVPVAVLVTTLAAWHLVLAGLITGGCGALLAPAQRALTSDIGDAIGAHAAARALSWQDLAHRVSMIFAPPLGVWLLATIGTEALLWSEAAGVLVAAVLVTRIPRYNADTGVADEPSQTTSIRAVFRRHRDVAAVIALTGVGGVTWFAFSLGMALLGAEVGRPGVLIAAAMTGYGIGSIAGALLATAVVSRLRGMPACAGPWLILGTVFCLLPVAAPDVTGIAVLGAIGGFSMPIGIAALNALITSTTTGNERRAAFAAENAIHQGGVAIGLLAGGAIIGAIGAGPTLVISGAAIVVASVAVLLQSLGSAHAPHSPPAQPDLASATASAPAGNAAG